MTKQCLTTSVPVPGAAHSAAKNPNTVTAMRGASTTEQSRCSVPSARGPPTSLANYGEKMGRESMANSGHHTASTSLPPRNRPSKHRPAKQLRTRLPALPRRSWTRLTGSSRHLRTSSKRSKPQGGKQWPPQQQMTTRPEAMLHPDAIL